MSSPGLRCPFCGSANTEVKDTRSRIGENSIRRRRICVSETCGKRFTTYETVGGELLSTKEFKKLLERLQLDFNDRFADLYESVLLNLPESEEEEDVLLEEPL